MIIKQNRKHKDSVFVNLFYSDKTAETNLLSLSNTLHRGKFEEPVLIKKVKVEDVLYMNFKNDLSAVINNETPKLIEHQSSVNPNMPLRPLFYLGKAY